VAVLFNAAWEKSKNEANLVSARKTPSNRKWVRFVGSASNRARKKDAQECTTQNFKVRAPHKKNQKTKPTRAFTAGELTRSRKLGSFCRTGEQLSTHEQMHKNAQGCTTETQQPRPRSPHLSR
jgi:hypothetical protein